MEFLMRATKDQPQHVAGWFVSEKLNGFRCFWDGGASRGFCAADVPWANPRESGVCTGLWSRYGNIYHAPQWFIDALPNRVLLDGELNNGNREGGGERQDVASCVKKKVPDDKQWANIVFSAFDTPPLGGVYMDRAVTGVYFRRHVGLDQCLMFYRKQGINPGDFASFFAFGAAYKWLGVQTFWNEKVLLLKQTQLHTDGKIAQDTADTLFRAIVDAGGEGIMYRDPWSCWSPKVMKGLVKRKPREDTEAEIIGVTQGKGQFKNKVGAIVVDWNGKSFAINIARPQDREPGVMTVGKRVTFSYTGLSKDGIPSDARIEYREDAVE